jgi:hypothetical protein
MLTAWTPGRKVLRVPCLPLVNVMQKHCMDTMWVMCMYIRHHRDVDQAYERQEQLALVQGREKGRRKKRQR